MALSLPRLQTNRRIRTLLGGYVSVASVGDWIRAWAAALILLGPANGVLRLAGRLPLLQWRRGTYRAVERSWGRLASSLLGLRIDVTGVEQIERDQQYVVVALHEGFADGLALLQLPLSLTAVARDELAAFPLLGGQLVRGRHILIDPERPLDATRTLLREARDAVGEGDSLLLFPQGSILGIELAFQSGAFNLARQLGLPVLPVVLSGTHRVWEHPFSGRLRFNQRVTMAVLPPVPADEASQRQHEIEHLMRQHAEASMTSPRHFEPDRDGYWDGYRYQIAPAFPKLAASVAEHRRGSDAAGAR